jgi:hypothetical protein
MTAKRPEVSAFLGLGPLPDSRVAEVEHVETLGAALGKITPPVSRDEAIELATAFGPDDCFGLAWSLVHLIESAPGGPPLDAIPQSNNEWIVTMRQRSARSATARDVELSVRPEVANFLRLGPLPAEDGDEAAIHRCQAAIGQI